MLSLTILIIVIIDNKVLLDSKAVCFLVVLCQISAFIGKHHVIEQPKTKEWKPQNYTSNSRFVMTRVDLDSTV